MINRSVLLNIIDLLRELVDELERLYEEPEYVHIIHLEDDLYKFSEENKGNVVETISLGAKDECIRFLKQRFESNRVSETIFRLSKDDLLSLEPFRKEN